MSERLSIHYRCTCGSVQVWTYRERIPDVQCSACGSAVVRRPDPTAQGATSDERAVVGAMVGGAA